MVVRLPDGYRLQRRFDRQTKIQVIYDYVDVQEIKFDTSPIYDLIQPTPFLCLSDKEKNT